MKKRSSRLRVLSALSLCLSAMGLSACSSSNVVSVEFGSDNNVISVGQIDFSNYYLNVEYRNGDSEQIPVTESMIDKNDIFKLYKVGTHDITFYYDNFYTTATFIVEVNHFDDDIKFVTNDKYQGEDIFIQKYDGKPHSLELTQNIPVGTQIIYPDGNSFTDSKNTPYVVKAILVKDGYESKEITGKMLIVVNEFPNEYFDQIKFNDAVIPYDGKEHDITIENLPEELEVEYKIYDSTGRKIDKAVDAGDYNVYATFASKNHNYTIPDSMKTRTAKLTISKVAISCSSVSLEPIVKEYDGKSVEIEPIGYVPENVHYNITIKDANGNVVEDPVDAGVYNIELNFTSDKNHSPEPSKLTSTLTINKKVIDLSNLKYGLEEVTFDGTIKRYSLLDSQLDNSITPKFTYYKYGSDTPCEPSQAGKYIVDIDFEIANGDMNNYEFINIPSESAVLVINKGIIDLSGLHQYGELQVEYDGTVKRYDYFDGKVSALVNVVLTYYPEYSDTPCDPIEPGRYTVKVEFEIISEESENLRIINAPTSDTKLIITNISE